MKTSKRKIYETTVKVICVISAILIFGLVGSHDAGISDIYDNKTLLFVLMGVFGISGALALSADREKAPDRRQPVKRAHK